MKEKRLSALKTMETRELEDWLCQEEQEALMNDLGAKVGLTRVRAECFVRLWIYFISMCKEDSRHNFNLSGDEFAPTNKSPTGHP